MSQFPEGYFFIRNVASDLVLDVRANSTEPDADVIVFGRKPSGYDNQLWKYDSGFLINKNSGLVLEVTGYEGGGNITPSTKLTQAVQRSPPASLNQLWAYNYQTLMPYDPKVAITAKRGNFSPGTNAVVDSMEIHNPRFEWMFDLV